VNEKLSVGLGVMFVVLGALACKGKTDEGSADAAGATAVTTASAVSADPVASAAPSASVAASAAPKPSATVAAKPTCKGLMIEHRCARECTKDDDCPDPKERCAPFSGSDDDGQNVMGAVVCQYDKDNEPRAVKEAVTGPTVGVKNQKNGDSPRAGLRP
jgi:hypothetical protein